MNNDSSIERMAIPEPVMRVVRRLHKAGYQALLAGGCVRDMLLGREASDYDVATNAVPEVITGLFSRTLTIGAQFGVVVVLVGDSQVEVATFRSDVSYEDGRRPDAVVYTDAEHDAQRRDFTINGMFYDPIAQEVIDYVHGRVDLKDGIIRAIGAPDERFAEDHLRMLRAVRFSCRLGFQIEPDTWAAIVKYADQIGRISAERITIELEKILTESNRCAGIQMANDSGLLPLIFRNVRPEQFEIGLKVMAYLPPYCTFNLALAALLVDCEGAVVEALCRKLKTSNGVRKQARWLVEHRQEFYDAIPLSKGRLKLWLAEPLFEPLVQLIRAFLGTAGPSDGRLAELERQIEALGAEPISPPRFLDGHALIALGASAGPMIGKLADAVYLAQLNGEVQSIDEARAWVKRWLENR